MASSDAILPGYWASTNRTTALVYSKSSEDRICLSATQVSAFMTNPGNRHYKCTYDQRQVSKGAMNLHGQCVDKHGSVYEIEVHGEYGPEWLKLRAKSWVAGLPVEASTEAHRIAASCPADAKHPDNNGAKGDTEPRRDQSGSN